MRLYAKIFYFFVLLINHENKKVTQKLKKNLINFEIY